MRRRAALLWLALPLLLAAGGRSAEERLREAFLAGRKSDVARAGRDLGAKGLAPELFSPHRPSTLSAIQAAPSAPDAWELLVPLADLAAEPDRSIAASAARAAADIGVLMRRELVLELEIPTAHLERRLVLWNRIAADRQRFTDVRVHALEVAESLRRALPPAQRPPTAFLVEETIRDPDPEIRRAVLELLPAPLPERALAPVGALLSEEEEDLVALVAAQVLCDGLAFGDNAGPILDAAGEAGLARLRGLVANPDLPAALRLDAARCLAAGTLGPDERAALRALTPALPRHLRKELSRLRTEKP